MITVQIMNFIHVSAANDYLPFNWIGTNKKNQLKLIYLSENNSKILEKWVWEFSGIFFAKIWDLISY
jgi:hypothetical protein